MLLLLVPEGHILLIIFFFFFFFLWCCHYHFFFLSFYGVVIITYVGWSYPAIAFQVGSRLIELLIETAYIQPPADQLGDGPPDIRPAFVHTLKTVIKETQ